MSLSKPLKSKSAKTGGGYAANNRSLKSFNDRQDLVRQFLKYRPVENNERATMSNMYFSKSFVDNVSGKSMVIDEGIARSARSDVDPIWLLLTPVEYSQFIEAEHVRAGGTIPLAVLPEASSDPDAIPPKITNLDCNEEYPIMFKSVGMGINLTNAWLSDDQVKTSIQKSYEALKISFRRSFCRDAYMRALEVIPEMDKTPDGNVYSPDISLFMDQYVDCFDHLKLITQTTNSSVFVRHAIVPCGGFDHMAVRCKVNFMSNKSLSTTYQLRNQYDGTEKNLPEKKILPVGECNGVAIFEETGCTSYIQPSMREDAMGMTREKGTLAVRFKVANNSQLIFDFNTRKMQPLSEVKDTDKRALVAGTTYTLVFYTVPVIVGDLSVPIGEAITSPASSYFVQSSTNALEPDIRVVRQEAIAVHPTKLFPGTSVRVVRHAYYTDCRYYNTTTATATGGTPTLQATEGQNYYEKSHVDGILQPLGLTADNKIIPASGPLSGICAMLPAPRQTVSVSGLSNINNAILQSGFVTAS